MKVTLSPPQTVVLTLELEKREIHLLQAILGSMAGSSLGPRSVTSHLYKKLCELDPTWDRQPLVEQTIRLPDTWKDFE